MHYLSTTKEKSIVLATALITVGGVAFYIANRYIRQDHERVIRVRFAKYKHKELLAQLSECRGILQYMDKEVLHTPPPTYKETVGVGEQLLRLMEKIDGVTPALVIEAAGMVPWAEHEDELKQKYLKEGMESVFEMAEELRLARKSLIRKAERRAKRVDEWKRCCSSEKKKNEYDEEEKED